MSLEILSIARIIKTPGGEKTISPVFWIQDPPEADAAVEFMNTVAEKVASGFGKNLNLPDNNENTGDYAGQNKTTEAEKPKIPKSRKEPAQESGFSGDTGFKCKEHGKRIDPNESRLLRIFTDRNLCRQCLGKVGQ